MLEEALGQSFASVAYSSDCEQFSGGALKGRTPKLQKVRHSFRSVTLLEVTLPAGLESIERVLPKPLKIPGVSATARISDSVPGPGPVNKSVYGPATGPEPEDAGQ